MDLEQVVVVVAWLFALVTGVNDGAAMLAIGLRLPGLPPWGALLTVGTAVVVTPLVVGTAVATTLAQRLVTFDGDAGLRALLVAVATAVGTTSLLSRRGLPTSLTLALVGAITGAGLGAGFSVSWSTVVFVLLMALVAPLVGMGAGWALYLAAAALPPTSPLRRRVPPGHLVGFGLQCLAYGSNDAQKMLAVVAVAVGTQATVSGIGMPTLVAIGAVFMLGTIVGLPRMASTLGGGVLPMQPPAVVITEVASAGVVLATSAVGAPVSMTQAITGAMVGTGLGRRRGRIRWEEAARIAAAWVVTLPAALATAFVLAASVETTLG